MEHIDDESISQFIPIRLRVVEREPDKYGNQAPYAIIDLDLSWYAVVGCELFISIMCLTFLQFIPNHSITFPQPHT